MAIDKEKYFKDTEHCPYCNSENLNATMPKEKKLGKRVEEVEKSTGRGNVECLNCKKSWQETYKLVDVKELTTKIYYESIELTRSQIVHSIKKWLDNAEPDELVGICSEIFGGLGHMEGKKYCFIPFIDDYGTKDYTGEFGEAKPEKIAPMDKKKYFKDIEYCPYCNSENLEDKLSKGRILEFKNNQGQCDVRCSSCTRKWQEIYKLVDVKKLT